MGSRRPLVRPSQLLVGTLTIVAAVLALADSIRTSYLALGSALFLAGLGLVVVSGWARQVSLAQYGFLGVGAYFASAAEGLPFALRLAVGALGAAVVAIPVGLAASRLAGLALGALTLVVGLTLWSLARAPEVMSRIGGDTFLGATVSRPSMFESTRAYGLLAIAVAGGLGVAVLAFRRTRTGMALAALGAGDSVLSSVGYETKRLVIAAFVISAALAGAGGVLLAAGFGGVNSNDIVPFNSIVLYAFLFNAGSRRAAAALLTAALVPTTIMLALPGWLLPIVGGGGLIAAGATVPDGFLGLLDSSLGRRTRGAPTSPAPTAAPTGVVLT